MTSTITIFTDGGARGNPGPAASGVVITGFAGKERLICGKYLGVTTNNVAEYSAIILALQTVQKEVGEASKTTELKFFTDSLLVAKQLTGEYKIKSESLRELILEVEKLQINFAKVTFTHIPREANKDADREVNRILDQI